MLSVDEKIRLSHLEAQIEEGLSELEAGSRRTWKAFAEIRDQRLYRQTHSSFEAYCQEKWDRGRGYINKLIAAGQAIAAIEQELGTTVPLLGERAIRPLTQLEPATAAAALTAAQAIAGSDKPNGSHTERAAAAVKQKAAPPLQVGQAIEVQSADSPLHGQLVEIRAVDGVIVEVATAAGEVVPMLTTELLPPVPVSGHSKAAAVSPVDRLTAALELERSRVEVLNQMICRLVAAARSGSVTVELLSEAESLVG